MKPLETDMTPELRGRFEVMKQLASAGGLIYGTHWALTSVLRTLMEQTAYYAQGRETLPKVNQLRKLAGMYALNLSENKNPVTWTMNSKHFPEKDTGKARAFDFCILKPNREATWDLKWDNDKDDVVDYLELAQYAKAAGLESGAFWDKADPPHVQLPKSIA